MVQVLLQSPFTLTNHGKCDASAVCKHHQKLENMQKWRWYQDLFMIQIWTAWLKSNETQGQCLQECRCGNGGHIPSNCHIGGIHTPLRLQKERMQVPIGCIPSGLLLPTNFTHTKKFMLANVMTCPLFLRNSRIYLIASIACFPNKLNVKRKGKCFFPIHHSPTMCFNADYTTTITMILQPFSSRQDRDTVLGYFVSTFSCYATSGLEHWK